MSVPGSEQHGQRRLTQVIRCDPGWVGDADGGGQSDAAAAGLELACQAVLAGGLVGFPTETVYGLGACATSSAAVAGIFAAKGRPADNPLIVHVASLDALHSFVSPGWTLPPTYRALLRRFWPGPLTILVPATSPAQSASKISPLVTAGLDTVAVRMPSHPVARALLLKSQVPIAAPSANLSGRPSPTTAQHVLRDLDGKIDLILDGGPCEVGLESTVVDGLHPDGQLRILRLGGLSTEDIIDCLRQDNLFTSGNRPPIAGVLNRDYVDKALEDKPTTPGMKYKHYAPSAKVIILDPLANQDGDEHPIPKLSEFLSDLSTSFPISHHQQLQIGLMLIENSQLYQSFINHSSTNQKTGVSFHFSNLGSESKPEITAQRLFSSLRYLDEEKGVDLILVERIKEFGLGTSVMERLEKASQKNPYQKIQLN